MSFTPTIFAKRPVAMLFSPHSPPRAETDPSPYGLTAFVQALLLAGVTLAMTGCGSSMKTTLEKEWETEVDEARTLMVEPQREQLLVGEGKDITIHNGDGSLLYGEEESLSLGDLASEATQVAGVSVGSMEADEYKYMTLSEAGLALVFDYSVDDDIIRAIDLESGTQRWKQTDYRWSLEKYQAAGRKVVSEIAQAAGLRAGSAAASVNSELTRSRYVSNLVEPMPERNAMLLKTVSKLQLVDLETGEQAWSVSKTGGSRLLGTTELPSGDLIVAIGNATLLERATGGEEVLRIDPRTGEVRWRTDHEARALRALQVQNDDLLLTGEDGELLAYRLDDGTRILEADPGWGMANMSKSAVAAEYRGTRYTAPLTSSPVLQNGRAYTPAVLEVQTVGAPHLGTQKYDLRSGDQIWESDSISAMWDVRDLTLAGDRLVGRVTHPGGGALGSDPRQRVVAWNPSDGSIAWNKRMPYEQSKVHAIRLGALGMESLPKINLIVEENRAYTATDTSVAAIDVETGEVVQQAGVDVPGLAAWLTESGEDALVILREEGVEFRAKSDLSKTGTSVTFESDLVTFGREGEHLLARTEDGLHIVNVPQQSHAGTIAAEDASGLVVGNLRSGFAVTDQGDSVYVLTKDRVVQKYRIP